MTGIEHRFVKVNDLWLHVVLAGPEQGPLMIFLHGFPEFWYGWKEQIEFFAAAGYRVAAPDQRGYNLSDRPAGVDSYRLDVLAQDVVGLIEALGRDRAVIAGHDWGGIVAWWLGKHFPERVERLIVMNAPHWLAFREDLERNPAQWARSSYALFFQIPRIPEGLYSLGRSIFMALALQLTSRPGTFSSGDLQQYRRAWGQPGALKAMLNWYRALLRRPPPYPDNPYVAVPTLILWGCRDRFLGTELARASAALCVKGRLVLFRGATHWLQHEEAQQVNQMILGFISQPAGE